MTEGNSAFAWERGPLARLVEESGFWIELNPI